MPTSLPSSLVVETLKIVSYLRNARHPRAGTKAKYFLGYGFDPREPDDFARALLAHAQEAQLETTSEGKHGTILCFRGPLISPKVRLHETYEPYGRFRTVPGVDGS